MDFCITPEPKSHAQETVGDSKSKYNLNSIFDLFSMSLNFEMYYILLLDKILAFILISSYLPPSPLPPHTNIKDL